MLQIRKIRSQLRELCEEFPENVRGALEAYAALDDKPVPKFTLESYQPDCPCKLVWCQSMAKDFIVGQAVIMNALATRIALAKPAHLTKLITAPVVVKNQNWSLQSQISECVEGVNLAAMKVMMEDEPLLVVAVNFCWGAN